MGAKNQVERRPSPHGGGFPTKAWGSQKEMNLYSWKYRDEKGRVSSHSWKITSKQWECFLWPKAIAALLCNLASTMFPFVKFFLYLVSFHFNHVIIGNKGFCLSFQSLVLSFFLSFFLFFFFHSWKLLCYSAIWRLVFMLSRNLYAAC